MKRQASPPQLPLVLAVDDIPHNLQTLAEILSANVECDLSFATNGREALASTSGQKPDLILLDILMPGMSGFDVCAELKGDPETADIPVIFLTAQNESDYLVKGFEMGAADYIMKPFNAAELVARVKTQILLKKANDAATAKSQELRQLLHVLCHDLANSVGSIVSLLDFAKLEPEPVTEMLPLMTIAAHNAMDLITLVRDMRALDEGKSLLRRQSVNVADACAVALSIVSDKLKTKEIAARLDIQKDLCVMADPTVLINSILCNLITNAIKFSERGSSIAIHASADERGLAKISVKDSGVGIPDSILKVIFDLSSQTTRSGTEGETGTGFGMPLVKKFVEAFDGEIEILSTCAAASAADHGTTVIILLHTAPPQASVDRIELQ